MTTQEGLRIYDEVWPAIRPHSCVIIPTSHKIFDGRKYFWQSNATIEICIFEHSLSAQYEIVSYDPKKRVELDKLYIGEKALLRVMQADMITRKQLCNASLKESTIADFIMTRVSYNAGKIRYIPRLGDSFTKSVLVSCNGAANLQPAVVQWMANFSKSRREIEDMMEDKMQQALLLNKSLQSCPNQTPTRLLRRQRSRSHSPESRPWTSKRDSVEGDPRIISQMSPETVSNTGSKSTQYETPSSNHLPSVKSVVQNEDIFNTDNIVLQMVKHSSGRPQSRGAARRPLRRLRSRSLSPETMKQSLLNVQPDRRRSAEDIVAATAMEYTHTVNHGTLQPHPPSLTSDTTTATGITPSPPKASQHSGRGVAPRRSVGALVSSAERQPVAENGSEPRQCLSCDEDSLPSQFFPSTKTTKEEIIAPASAQVHMVDRDGGGSVFSELSQTFDFTSPLPPEHPSTHTTTDTVIDINVDGLSLTTKKQASKLAPRPPTYPSAHKPVAGEASKQRFRF